MEGLTTSEMKEKVTISVEKLGASWMYDFILIHFLAANQVPVLGMVKTVKMKT